MASRGFGGAVLRAYGIRDHAATVIERSDVTAHCVRIRFHSDTVFDDVVFGATSWIRGWFPDGNGKEHQRGYTFVDADPSTGDFSIDFVLHEPSGPAAQWARRGARRRDRHDVGEFGAVRGARHSPVGLPPDR